MSQLQQFLAKTRSDSDLQTQLMGCPTAQAFVDTASAAGFELDVAAVEQWQEKRIAELEDTELDTSQLSDVAGGFSSPISLKSSLLQKNQFIPGDMYKFMMFIAA